MEETINLNQDDVLEVISNFPIIPLNGEVIITVNTDDVDEEGLETNLTSLSELQYIISVSKFNPDELQPGQKVIIDIPKMTEKDGSISIYPINVDGNVFTMISHRLIKAIDNR